MKHLNFLLSFLIVGSSLNAQSLNDFQSALKKPGKAVQAIHHYPQKNECHWVEVTSISITRDNIKIVETWSGWTGSKTHTTLTGKYINGIAEGEWESDASSGNWSYNFITNVGKWNKTKSSWGTFKEWQPLRFKITDKDQIKDGRFDCY